MAVGGIRQGSFLKSSLLIVSTCRTGKRSRLCSPFFPVPAGFLLQQGGHNEYRLSPQTEPVVLWIQSCTFLRYCVVCLVISPETKTQVVLVRTSTGQTLPTRHTGSPESTTSCHEKATRQKRQPWPREIKSNPTAFPGPDRLLFSARTNSLVSRSHSSAIPRWLGVPVTKPRQSNPS